MNIQVITLDLDYTLWDPEQALIRAQQLMQDWFHQNHPALDEFFNSPNSMRAARAAVIEARPELKVRLSELRINVLQQGLQGVGYTPSQALEVAQAGFGVFYRERSCLQFFPKTLPTLNELAKTFTLVAISNGNADLKLLNLVPPFAFGVNPDSVGIAKPDPGIFEHALQLSGHQPHQCVHIGDHPSDDVAGARAAGITPLWFNPQHLAWKETTPEPDQIHCLSEIAERVRRL